MAPLRRSSKPVSAGLVLFRLRSPLEVLIAHPGGPFWRNRDAGAWSIPKGIVRPGEDELAAARREFEEETGLPTPASGYLGLGSVTQKSGKRVVAWALEGDADAEALTSNTFTIEWPPGSGRSAEFPELDTFLWASPEVASAKLNKAQIAFVSRLVADIGA